MRMGYLSIHDSFFLENNVLNFGIYTPIFSIILGLCLCSSLSACLNLTSPSVWIVEWFFRPYGSKKLTKKVKKTQHSWTVLNAMGQGHCNKKHRKKRKHRASNHHGQPWWLSFLSRMLGFFETFCLPYVLDVTCCNCVLKRA